MKKLLILLLLASGVTNAETVLRISIEPIIIKVTPDSDQKVTWTAPTEREDGTQLGAEEIQSYTIYGGTEPGKYTREVTVTGATEVLVSEFDIKEAGTWYFTGITTDTDGLHSVRADEIAKVVVPVNRPIKFTVAVEP